jgi:ParD-like antitoxin of type II bacterial toxin-antitoxin system
MGQPVKLSDEMILEARTAGAAMGRSIAGQVEFWASIGRTLEKVANRSQIERLQQRATLPLSEIVSTVNGPAGRARLSAYLESKPFPRFSAHPEVDRLFVREDADGTRTVGRFNRGTFEPTAVPEAIG